jgi:hypothetical protein
MININQISTRFNILRKLNIPFLLFLFITFVLIFSTSFLTPSSVQAINACPSGGYYCGNDGLNGNASTLYRCTGAGATPQVSQNCSYGCKINPPGVADVCNSAPSGPCPSSGDYCGGTVGQNSNNLYYCSGAGANPTLKQTCSSNGCQYNPSGTADVCKAPPPTGPCPSSGDYCGGTVGQNSNNLYNCTGTGANPTLKQTCSSNGCQYNPSGTADVCKAPPASGPCPSSGDYCGGTVGQNSNNLYNCTGAGANPTLKQTCSSNGCQYNPSGTADVCKAPPASGLCPSSGDYCGVSVGQNSNNLYNCTGAGANPTLKNSCSNGCKVNSVGVADVCYAPAPTGCTAGGDFCGSSVGQNSNNLYYCSGAGASPTLKQSCSLGCHINPVGTADVCKTASVTTCPNGNGMYCGTSVGLNSSTLYQCTNGTYSAIQSCGNGCQQNAPGTADSCKSSSPTSNNSTLIFPMQTGTQNVSDYKIEPGFRYGSGPVYVWLTCDGSAGNADVNYSANKYHAGIDIIGVNAKGTEEVHTNEDKLACQQGSLGAKVVAVGDGIITSISNTPTSGDLITLKLDTLDNGDTIYAMYMHVVKDSSIVLNGRVVQGAPIGTVGQFSGAHNPHLHFEMHTFPNWDGGYSLNSNPNVSGYRNPCDVISRHGGAVPDSCSNVNINGGFVVSADEAVKLNFPANAVDKDVLIQIQPITGTYIPTLNQNLSLGGGVYQLSALTDGKGELTTFGQQVALTMKYNPDLLLGRSDSKLSVYYYNIGFNAWVKVTAGFAIDSINNTLTVLTDHFSEYAVVIENTPPTFTQIPSQIITSGQSFSTINLGLYATDVDSGDVITWSNTQNSNISVSITNNIATLTYPTNWTGTENITFKATDISGAFATSTGVFTVNPSSTNVEVELLPSPWHLTGNNGAKELYQGISTSVLAGKTTMRITYDLHGLNALGGDASAIIFDQNGWQFISLSNYGENGKNGLQTVDIPLSNFTNLNLANGSNTIHTRFWYGSAFTVDITSIKLIGPGSSGGSTTNNPPAITSTPVTSVNENSQFSYDVNATDTENNTLVYSLTQGKTGMTVNSSTGLISWIPSFSDSGTFPITVSVSDGSNAVTQSFNLVVNNVNRAPVVTQIPGQSISIGQTFSTINLSTYGSDPDSNPISWTYSGNTNITVTIANNVATLTYLSSWTGGSENITFKATDSLGAFTNSTIVFTVNPVSTGIELLTTPWHLTGNNGASEKYKSINTSVLAGKTTLRITYDLHGLNALGGDASAIIFDQNGWKFISLSNYGQNGKNGVQTVDIPLSSFPGLNLTTGSNTIHTRFWYGSAFTVDITSIKVL